MLQVEIVLGHALNVVGGAAQVMGQFRVGQPGIFSDHRSGGERDGLFFIGIAAQNKSGNFLVFGFFELPGFGGLRSSNRRAQ